jgi:hypothetical protein
MGTSIKLPRPYEKVSPGACGREATECSRSGCPTDFIGRTVVDKTEPVTCEASLLTLTKAGTIRFALFL